MRLRSSIRCRHAPQCDSSAARRAGAEGHEASGDWSGLSRIYGARKTFAIASLQGSWEGLIGARLDNIEARSRSCL